MASESSGIQKSSSTFNKPLFKITDNSDKNKTIAKDNVFLFMINYSFFIQILIQNKKNLKVNILNYA